MNNLQEHPTSDISAEGIHRLMRKAQVELAPSEFAAQAGQAFSEAQAAFEPQHAIPSLLRSCHSYGPFQEAIRRAGPAKRVLALGCGGDGIFGLSSGYAREEWLRIWPSSKVVSFDLTAASLRSSDGWPTGPFDAVISISMVHYVYELQTFFAAIRQALGCGGVYVFAREANAAYFAEPALRQAWEQWISARPRKSLLRRLAKTVREQLSHSTAQKVIRAANRIAKERFHFAADLSSEDFRSLIEFHRPTQPPKPTQIGMQGFDPADLCKRYLPGFSLSWMGTSGHLGYVPYGALNQEWAKRAAALAERYPYQGAILSAVLRKDF